MGGYLLGLWGLSDALVEAVVFHHDPADCVQEVFSALAAVHVANAMDEARGPTLTGGTASTVDKTYLRACGLVERANACRIMDESGDQAKNQLAA